MESWDIYFIYKNLEIVFTQLPLHFDFSVIFDIRAVRLLTTGKVIERSLRTNSLHSLVTSFELSRN